MTVCFSQTRERGLLFANDVAAELTGFASGAELRQATLRAVAERFDFLDPQGRSVPLTALLALTAPATPPTGRRHTASGRPNTCSTCASGRRGEGAGGPHGQSPCARSGVCYSDSFSGRHDCSGRRMVLSLRVNAASAP